MHSDQKKSFVFAAVLCVVCSFLLTFASSVLKPIQLKNIKADQQRNILKVLDLIEPGQAYTAEELSSIYESSVKNAWLLEDGSLLYEATESGNPLFLSVQDGQLQSYAIPISGFGLWSTLYGYLSLKGDGVTVQGITFYEHGETPGLGAEVEKAWFQDNFKGKRIVNDSGEFVSVGVVKGSVTDKISESQQVYFVDGISGATVTSVGVQKFLYSDLQKYESFSSRLRRDGRF